jgi:hypothetical protein
MDRLKNRRWKRQRKRKSEFAWRLVNSTQEPKKVVVVLSKRAGIRLGLWASHGEVN